MPDASPTRWHLAHTTWFFETFVLRTNPDRQPYDAAFESLFNSYYNAVGDKHPRPERGLLTRPALDEVLDYRHEVDASLSPRARVVKEFLDLTVRSSQRENVRSSYVRR